LRARFPEGSFEKEGFVADDGTMQRIFNSKGYEIQRSEYKRILKNQPHMFDIISRDFSEYDEEGYLTRYTLLEIGKIGFTATLEYKTNSDGTKELIREVNQDVLRNGLRMEPGKTTGEPFVIDLSDVPLVE
jgi:hypothetical protein